MSSDKTVKIGIIGGTGLDDPDLLENRIEKAVTTPFGKPSDVLIFGQIKGIDCVLLARHGRSHDVNPSRINYCANIWALKDAGCSCIVVTSACGSLKEDIHPGEVVILDQFIDWTRNRRLTYYDCSAETPFKGVCHIPMAEPFCPELRKVLIDITSQHTNSCHESGTIVVIEGPRFSSKAESRVFQSFGASVIGMTTVPEVTLAKELGIPYASIALVTDYDCWRDDGVHVNVESVTACLRKSAELAKNVIVEAIPHIAAIDWTTVCARYETEVKSSVM
jgi:5'-methylthioadenosine phosphorylase